MKEILAFILLLFSGTIHAQQFTTLPTQAHSGFSVRDATEIGSSYFFLTTHNYDSSGTQLSKYKVHRTDSNGQILDSLIFRIMNQDSVFTSILFSELKDNTLCLYTNSFKTDTSYYFRKFSLGRIRFDENLNFIDSFSTSIPVDSIFYGFTNWKVIRYGSKICYALKGYLDTFGGLNYQHDRLYALDTNGNFIGQTKLYEPYGIGNFGDITALNDSNIMVSAATPTPGTGRWLLDKNLNVISYKDNGQHVMPFYGALNRYDDDKVTMMYVYNDGNNDDSMCVDIYDTSNNLLRHKCIAKDTMFLPSDYPTLQTEPSDAKDRNNIFICSNFGLNVYNLVNDSYFYIHNLDSNLNVRWSKVYGGEYPYWIWRVSSTSDGGCFVLGLRRIGSTATDSIDPVVFKLNQQGLLTNITSFAPSVNQYITVFPNPSSNILNVKNEYKKGYELMIFSQDGRVVYNNENIVEELHRVEVSNLAKGLYLYKIRTVDERSATGRFIKE